MKGRVVTDRQMTKAETLVASCGERFHAKPQRRKGKIEMMIMAGRCLAPLRLGGFA
jgi:hypothetical protein